jgi:hypothetical protein
MTVQLHPSFFRCAVAVTSVLLVVCIIGYFRQGYLENHWWTSDYVLSLLIPLVVVPVLTWFMFVPSRLEFSDTDFTIKFLFRSLHNFVWLDLHSYGPGENVFVIQFTARTFQILPQAYRRTDRRMLENFLSSRFPDKKVSNHRGY